MSEGVDILAVAKKFAPEVVWMRLQELEAAEARVAALTQVAEAARDDLRGALADIIAIKGHLIEPYPEDPRWTPWTRFAERALRAIENTRDSLARVGQE